MEVILLRKVQLYDKTYTASFNSMLGALTTSTTACLPVHQRLRPALSNPEEFLNGKQLPSFDEPRDPRWK